MKLKFYRLVFVASLLAIGLCTTCAQAGQISKVHCTNQKCLKDEYVTIKGAMSYGQVTGYCYRENKFVSLEWWRKGTPQSFIDHSPSPSGWSRVIPIPQKIWSPLLGETLSLYKCPTCPFLFLPILRLSEVKFCPKCHEPDVELRDGMVFD